MESNAVNPDSPRPRAAALRALLAKRRRALPEDPAPALTGNRVPASIGVDGAAPTVLAFHGFGGTPFEVELAVQAAADLGLAARAPLLPGHGTSVHDLSQTRFTDWTRGARAAFDELPAGEVVLVGFSLGSLLAIELAAQNPERVAGLVLLGNATRLTSPFPSLALALVERLGIPDFLVPKKHGADIADAAARSTHVTYPFNPVHAAIDVRRAGLRMSARARDVRCPTLILHGAKDRVCPVANAWRVAEDLGTDDCRVVIFPRSRHILTRDFEKDAVRRELATFFERIRAAG
jgi:carboxylesterase